MPSRNLRSAEAPYPASLFLTVRIITVYAAPLSIGLVQQPGWLLLDYRPPSLADMADFLQKSAISAVFLAEIVQ
jgi:hypothetical protein